MKKLTDILRGYVDPKTAHLHVSPLGRGGLSGSIAEIRYLQLAFGKLIDDKPLQGDLNEHAHVLRRTLLALMVSRWHHEISKVMDSATLGNGKSQRENLTVALCHREFQAELTMDAVTKAEEDNLYQALHDHYIFPLYHYKDFRHRSIAHKDFEDTINPKLWIGDFNGLTNLNFEWYRFVAKNVYGTEPRFFVEGPSNDARHISEELTMLVTSVKELAERKDVDDVKRLFSEAGLTLIQAIVNAGYQVEYDETTSGVSISATKHNPYAKLRVLDVDGFAAASELTKQLGIAG